MGYYKNSVNNAINVISNSGKGWSYFGNFAPVEVADIEERKKINIFVRNSGALKQHETTTELYYLSDKAKDMLEKGYIDWYLYLEVLELRQRKQDEKLDLDIEQSTRVIRFYKFRYLWLLGFTILGGLVGWFLRQPITQLESEMPKEEPQQKVLKTQKEHISTPLKIDSSQVEVM